MNEQLLPSTVSWLLFQGWMFTSNTAKLPIRAPMFLLLDPCDEEASRL